MRDRMKKIYSFVGYYFPKTLKILDYIFLYLNNIFYDRKNYNKKMSLGEKLYNQLIRDKQYFYVIIDKGIGDTLIVASYAKNISNKKICFIVPKFHKEICEFYKYIDNVKVYEKEELDSLTFYICMKKLYKRNNVFYAFFQMKVAKSGFRCWTSAKWNKKIFLSERYKKYVFGLEPNKKMLSLSINGNDNTNNSLEKKYNITDNSILLVPYAYTEVNLSLEFWEKLASTLIECGYSVFTNVGNPRVEKVIKGTNILNCSLKEAAYLSKSFKKIISLRCGFCELLSASETNMIVLNNSKNYDMWDDVKIYNNKSKIYNYYVKSKNYDKIISEIIDILEKE